MTTLVLETEPIAIDVTVTRHSLTVDLADGRRIVIPAGWYPRLAHGTTRELLNWRLLGAGYAIEWPDLDEHIGIEGLLAGRRSGENKKSLRRWLAERSRVRPAHRKVSESKRQSTPRPKSRSVSATPKERRG